MDSKTRAGEMVVAGVGGAGVNAVLRLTDHETDRVRLVAVDSSAQALSRVRGVRQVLLTRGTGGWGTGGDVELGRQAARSARDEILSALDGADFVLVVGGLAGGTGGGAAPEVARQAREAGAAVIGFGIEPFGFEGGRAHEASRRALDDLTDACDACFPMDTARAVSVVGDRLPLDTGLRVADDVLRQALEGLHGLIHARGWIDVGALGVRSALEDCGQGCLSVGMGRGAEPALAAMRAALASPLVDMSLVGRARSALVHLAGDREMAVSDVAAAMELLRRELAPDCRMVVGCAPTPALVDTARVTIMALTGRLIAREHALPALRPAALAAARPAASGSLPERYSQRIGWPLTRPAVAGLSAFAAGASAHPVAAATDELPAAAPTQPAAGLGDLGAAASMQPAAGLGDLGAAAPMQPAAGLGDLRAAVPTHRAVAGTDGIAGRASARWPADRVLPPRSARSAHLAASSTHRLGAGAPTQSPAAAGRSPSAGSPPPHPPSAAAEFSRKVRERVPTLDSLRKAEAERTADGMAQAV